MSATATWGSQGTGWTSASNGHIHLIFWLKFTVVPSQPDLFQKPGAGLSLLLGPRNGEQAAQVLKEE